MLHTLFVFYCADKLSLTYSNRDGHEPAAMLVNRSNAQDEDTVEHITYASIDDVAPSLHELPVSESHDQSQYEDVVEHRTVEPVIGNPLYEGVGFGASSAARSLFYQYVPSKVRNLLAKHIGILSYARAL